MSSANKVDGVLAQWGDRLFYPGNRIVKVAPPPRLASTVQQQAAVNRHRIETTVGRRAPQVVVRVTGGGRGMKAIAAQLRYISKGGRLEFEDDRGVVHQGKEELLDLLEQWRFGGSLIRQTSPRREALCLVLSMPSGTDAQTVLQAVREFARIELNNHRYVMVLHQHQASPHVHLSVRGESLTGERLRPDLATLHHWRETFARSLRERGVEAQATRQSTRCEVKRLDEFWQIKARESGRLKITDQPKKSGEVFLRSRTSALEAWAHITRALLESDQSADRELAHRIVDFINDSAFVKEISRQQARETESRQVARVVQPMVSRPERGRDIER